MQGEVEFIQGYSGILATPYLSSGMFHGVLQLDNCPVADRLGQFDSNAGVGALQGEQTRMQGCKQLGGHWHLKAQLQLDL